MLTPMPRLAAFAAALLVVLAGCGPIVTVSPSVLPNDSVGASGIDPSGIRADLEALQAMADANDGVRTAGTAGYDASVGYVAERLRALGYEVQTPAFEMATFSEDPGASIGVGEDGAAFAGGADFHAMIYSAAGAISAEVAKVGYGAEESGGCAASDFADFPAGAIAVAPPGPCFRRDVVLNAVDAGAAALVVAYPQWSSGAVRRPTLISPDGIEIPALSASGEVGEALTAAAEAGTQVTVEVKTRIGSAMVRNVLADSRGGAGRVVMLGAHLDSAHDGPGINDNGSGVAALLEMARVLAEEQPSLRVRFGFWGGEEFGFFGSRAYVETLGTADRDAIVAYLNFDMLGSPNWVPLVYESSTAVGSAAITDFLVRNLEEAGIGAETTDLSNASDHASFDEVGIPTGGIFSGASEIKTAGQAAAFGGTAEAPMDACYHLACDTLANVNIELVAAFAGAALALTRALASGELRLG
jgi:Zn-dependent M28 family amino/carboxypeptidase